MLTKRIFLATAAAVALFGCGASGPAETTVNLSMTGAADMNGGAPAQAKVYYLTDTTAFRSADFFAVFNQPEATLGDALIKVETYQLTPGGTVTDTQSFPAAAPTPTAIGVVGAFRDINGAFLQVRPLAPNVPNTVQVTLSGNTVTLR